MAHQLSVLVDSALYFRIQAFAQANGITLSEAVRDGLRRVFMQELTALERGVIEGRNRGFRQVQQALGEALNRYGK